MTRRDPLGPAVMLAILAAVFYVIAWDPERFVRNYARLESFGAGFGIAYAVLLLLSIATGLAVVLALAKQIWVGAGSDGSVHRTVDRGDTASADLAPTWPKFEAAPPHGEPLRRDDPRREPGLAPRSTSSTALSARRRNGEEAPALQESTRLLSQQDLEASIQASLEQLGPKPRKDR